MTKSELKKLVKECVKECMAELFLEIKLENVIESAISKGGLAQPQQRQALNERAIPAQRQVSKSDLRKKMGISEKDFENIYGSVVGDPMVKESVNPTAQPKPPEVSENDLADAGLFRDYSKFI